MTSTYYIFILLFTIYVICFVLNLKTSVSVQYFKYPATLRREEAAAAVSVTVSRLSLSHLLSGRGAVIKHSGLDDGSRHILEG